MSQKILNIDRDSPESKYRQIVNSVLDSVASGDLSVGDQLPSVNDLCKAWGYSRDTVLNAYAELKSIGILKAIPGKGYYIESTQANITHKVLLLFDELNPFKEELYNSFLTALGNDTFVDIYFHHFNRKVFDSLLSENNGLYTTYVVMPAKFTGTAALLQSLKGRVIVLDQLPNDLAGLFPAVYQNFENDTYQSLLSGRELISKYNKLIMVYPGGKEPEGQFKGFMRFSQEEGVPFELTSDFNNRQVTRGECYIVIWDRDLVKVVKASQEANIEIGRDVGIISYNDTPLKQVVANGITTISTNFVTMGKTLAQLVMSKKRNQVQNPSSLIVRGSL